MKNTNLESIIIRAVWSSVEMFDQQALLHLNDTDLVRQVINQVERAFNLSIQERQSALDYVSSKVRLIKDIAEF